MRPLLTAQNLATSTRCLRCGDIVYIPQAPSQSDLENASRKTKTEPWFGKLADSMGQPIEHCPDLFVPSFISIIYDDARLELGGKEPHWIRFADPVLKRKLRHEYALHGETYGQLFCVPLLPFSGIGYVVMEGGFTEEICKTFNLYRLQHIKQLGYLTDPMVRTEESSTVGFSFHHNRLTHSLDVAATGILIALKNPRWLGSQDVKTVKLAGLAHDIRTPAGGDTTKMVDPAAFDEDAGFPEIFEEIDWEPFRKRHRLSERKLVETVQGLGTLGALLDIADKIAYVGRDLGLYLSRYAPNGPAAYPGSGYEEIRSIVSSDPLVCGFWDSVRVEPHGEVIVTDAERLGRFLKLRALLFRGLYHHPGARFLEYLVAKVVVQYLYDTGRLTRQTLLLMRDEDLDHLVVSFLGEGIPIHPGMLLEDMNLAPRLETFASLEEARVRTDALRGEGKIIVHLEALPRSPKPGTHLLVGRNTVFEEARPEEAAEIRRILSPENPYLLHYFEGAKRNLSPHLEAAFNHARQKESFCR